MHVSSSAAVYVISVAADLAGMHPQTLRQYDRLGLVIPERTAGRGRRYSGQDIAKLRLIQQLSQDEGVNLVGIKKIIDLQNQVEALQRRTEKLEAEVQARMTAQEREARVFAAGTAGGDVVSISRGRRPRGRPEPGALVLYNRYRRG